MNGFKEVIKEKNDEDLIMILSRSQDYQPEFIELVKKEVKEVRNIKSDENLVRGESDEELISYCDQSKNPDVFWEQTDCLGQSVSTIPFERVSDSEEIDEEAVNQIYEFASNLLFKKNQGKQDVINELIKNNIDKENAEIVVNNLISSRNERAEKDMLYGALWFIGGIIATVANFGYIFWGAIVFGAIQFARGLTNHS